jgi:hypothetical protein
MNTNSEKEKQKENLINIAETDQVEYWTNKLNITKVQLKAAINAVGNVAEKVEIYIKKR